MKASESTRGDAATMTKTQLATIRREMAVHTFDTTDYLKLSVMTLGKATGRKAAAKRKTTPLRKAKSKKK